MAHLTDSLYKSAGHTILYMPDEGHNMDNLLAHKDKELVQRLEGEGQRRVERGGGGGGGGEERGEGD